MRIHRTGAVYVAVLMASLLIASLVMAALASAHHHARDQNDESEYRLAQIAADAALEWAVAAINTDPNWRSNHTNNVASAARQLGSATMRYRLIDKDGNLADDAFDSCDLLVTASTGDARFAWRCTLEGAGAALNCLSYALAARDEVKLNPSGKWSTDGALASQKNVVVESGASLTANCFTAEGSSGAIYGSTASLATNLQIPTASILDQYTAMGTSINAALLPSFLGILQLDKQLLSPNANTISGQLNSQGVYVINCGGQKIAISNSRLHCTLVLKNVGSDSRVEQSVYWEAAQPNYPALLVDGKFDLLMTRTPLRESDVGRNLNPDGTPFRGQSDGNTGTIYPSQIRGLIYASQLIMIRSNSSANDIFGVILGGEKVSGEGNLFMHYRDIYTYNPPPGFRAFDLVRIKAGSVRKVAHP